MDTNSLGLTSMLQSYEEALACLEVVAHYLRINTKSAQVESSVQPLKKSSSSVARSNNVSSISPQNTDVRRGRNTFYTVNIEDDNLESNYLEQVDINDHNDVVGQAPIDDCYGDYDYFIQSMDMDDQFNGHSSGHSMNSSYIAHPVSNSEETSHDTHFYVDSHPSLEFQSQFLTYSEPIVNTTGEVQSESDFCSSSPGCEYPSGECSSLGNNDYPSDCNPPFEKDESLEDVDYAVLAKLIDRCSMAIDNVASHSKSGYPSVQQSLQHFLKTLTAQKAVLVELQARKKSFSLQPALEPTSFSELPDRSEMHMAISSMRSTPQGRGLQTVVGLDEVKRVLQEAFVMPVQLPHLFNGSALKAWSRLLLYGPPGTGKTRLARALAMELRCPLYTVTPSTLLSSWLGESEKMVKAVFEQARQEQGPVLLFIDEMDALCRIRASSDDAACRRVKTELLIQLDAAGDEDELNSHKASRLFVIAATNCPWDVDPAFLRRFQKRCYVPLPDREERRILLERQLYGCRQEISEEDWTVVLEATKGMSGADLASLAATAAFVPLWELYTNRFWKFSSGNMIEPCSCETLGAMQYTYDKLPPFKVQPRYLKGEDLLHAARNTPRSVSTDLLQQYSLYAER